MFNYSPYPGFCGNSLPLLASRISCGTGHRAKCSSIWSAMEGLYFFTRFTYTSAPILTRVN